MKSEMVSKVMGAKTPSLVDLCVENAIDYTRFLGDVGQTDSHLLERILPHCTVEQLMNVENETRERDISDVTDKLWKKFYATKFGAENTSDVVERMNASKQRFLWRQLYQVKLNLENDRQTKSLERLTQRYKQEDERRKSRQTQFVDKAPTSGKKCHFYGGHGVINRSNMRTGKSDIMKKTIKEHHHSVEMMNRVAMKRKGIPRTEIVAAASNPGNSSNKPQCKPRSESFKPCVYQSKASSSSHNSYLYGRKPAGGFQLSRLLKLVKEEEEIGFL